VRNIKSNPELLFKIVDGNLWAQATVAGVFAGAAIDLRDGYIHLSSATQVEDTARLHFAGVHDLVLVAFRESQISAPVKWEPSRGGQLFPHVYGTLDPARAEWVEPLPWQGQSHQFPVGFQT
jgi:uncharacterized protein (DUF952 family)